MNGRWKAYRQRVGETANGATKLTPCAGMLPVVAVHGGAGKVSSPILEEKMVALRAAVDAGYVLLQHGGTSVDAVEAAVRVMEDHPAFNAGFGSSLTNEGSVEMDALIMEGALMKAGAVGAVRTVRNPVTLARKVMEETEHVLLVGPAADRFAQEMGIPLVDNGSLVSAKAKQRLEEFQSFRNTVQRSINVDKKEHDTVGAVAVDVAGHVACATSTGGLTGQLCGRVGDSPLVGAGGFADDSVCAISTTGHGEAIARSCLAYDMATRLQAGKLTEAKMAALYQTGPHVVFHLSVATLWRLFRSITPGWRSTVPVLNLHIRGERLICR
ncbi:isoaspartyl peptidase/L-asparaginase isoform X2 [Dermacentor andersoni]|uniref:isoaspartyl peptidase/L-asparaginase isoform X2 n=1 Tax=Dermacentor andersoni TaxID=34620 RepID=UPI0024169A71|nr:isoaspartyl peptidase/L-asparaginase-like isoform X2 [Dermacentor andersoni]